MENTTIHHKTSLINYLNLFAFFVQCHPDKDLTNRKLHGQFLLINEAYKVLHNPVTRQMYDMQMASSQYTGQHVGQYAGVAAGYKTYGFEGHSSKNQAHW
jgi:DnaJ-class molecular chaperone